MLAVALVSTCLLRLLWLDATDKASRAICTSNLMRIGQAMSMYAQDNDGYYPAATQSEPTLGMIHTWCWLLDPYLHAGVTTDLNVDPFFANGSPDGTKESWGDSGGSVWHCPDDHLGSNISYACNPWVAGYLSAPDFRLNLKNERMPAWQRSLRSSEVPHPSETIFAGDSNKFWDESKQQYDDVFADWVRSIDGPVAGRTHGQTIAWYRGFLQTDYTDSEGDCQSPGEWSCKGPAYRHFRHGDRTGSANMLFCDGHVKMFPFGSMKAENVFPELAK